MILGMTSLSVKLLPIVAGMISSLIVSLKRIDDVMQKDEKIEKIHNHNEKINDNIDIKIINATFSWSHESTHAFCLKDISININAGKLVGIVGSVGSGKTSLIQSILGEMSCISGKIYVNNNNNEFEIGYCSQTPYIRNATLRDNIILNLDYDQDKYRKCILSSALFDDLAVLPNYDLTLIGDEGVNLSGGQKMRVSFARILYRSEMNNKCNIFLFDDPLSSVDIYVGKHMFLNGILKYFKQKNKTCIMVINSHLHLLHYFDEIIIMDKGKIAANSSIKNLLNDNNNKYSHLYNLNQNIRENQENKQDDKIKKEYNFDFKYNSDDNKLKLNQVSPPKWSAYFRFITASLSTFNYKHSFFYNSASISSIITTKKVYIHVIIMIFVFSILFVIQSLSPICNIWIYFWNQLNIDNNKSNLWYLSIWIILLITIAISTAFSMNYISSIFTKSSHSIHSRTLCSILRAHTLFFDITPRGKLMNLFSKDTNCMDIILPMTMFQLIMNWCDIIGIILINLYISPLATITFIIIILLFLFNVFRIVQKCYYFSFVFQKMYLGPILTLFGECVTNLDSIRAYKLQNYFIEIMNNKINAYCRYRFTVASMCSWLGLYAEITFNFAILCSTIITCYLAINTTDHFKIGLLMLSVWNYIVIQSLFRFALSLIINIQRDFISVQRMMYYCDTEQILEMHESSQINTDYGLYYINNKISWPSIGNISISKLTLRYRPQFNIVLNINSEIIINSGSKIGICGRTGSGKSSILVSIFRIFEPLHDSKIIIDNLNIYKLGLYDLRSSISIIMQTPILFYGNLRFNLDPFNNYDDNEIWNALRDVSLYNLINNRSGKLLCFVDENGSNFSLGEKQLIIFARAILKKSKILFMDEATSSIDKNTDNIIQSLIRSSDFKDITVITIAHRLETIIDYDYVLVLKNGEITEYDKPKNLLKNQKSMFSQLIKTSKLYYSS